MPIDEATRREALRHWNEGSPPPPHLGPRAIRARFAQRCRGCGASIAVGERVLLRPGIGAWCCGCPAVGGRW